MSEWQGQRGWVLPTAGVTGEAIGVIQAPHRLARLPRSVDAKPTLDTNACAGEAEQQLVLCTVERDGQAAQAHTG